MSRPDSLAELLDPCRDQVLLQVVSGSHAYGLATPTSDIDERGAFALPLRHYASLREPTEHLQDERGDVAYYSLRKFLRLLGAGNPNALELLFTPPDCVRFCAAELDELITARALFVTRSTIHSHIGYAEAQIQRARGQNKWVNNPQPEEAPRREAFCRVLVGPWPGAEGAAADPRRMPMRPRPLAESGFDLAEFHCAALEHVPNTYRLYHYGVAAKGVFRKDHIVCESIPKEHEWSHFVGLLIDDEVGWQRARRDHAHYWQWRLHRNEARWVTQEAGEVDYDPKNLMHTLRLLSSAESILREGRPRVRFEGEQREFLLHVRAGTFSYDELVAQAEAKIAELRAMEPSCGLSAAPDPDRIDDLLRSVTAAWERRTSASGKARESSTPQAAAQSRTAENASLARDGVGPEERAAVATALAAVAGERRVRVLHACESGSRAWGFASPDSDFDVRFIYVHELDWYLRIGSRRDTIERMLPGDLDVSGWDLRKALALFASSNAPLFEHMGSDLIYQDEAGLLSRLRQLVPTFFNPIAVGHHYLGLAAKMRERYLTGETVNIKKLFYVLRPIAALHWVEQHSSMPPTRFEDALGGIDLALAERERIAGLRAKKASLNEVDSVALDPGLGAWIDERLQHFSASIARFPKRGTVSERLDELLIDMVRNFGPQAG